MYRQNGTLKMRRFDTHWSLCQSKESEYTWTHNKDGTIYTYTHVYANTCVYIF